ncbi:M43 family zinc metalloprotease [Hymenobacter sp. B1770]|uniref:M43 family zinc metalloprotease n=1 Tax=Hymenobacter sp. B1770 TaxID=1718788 RepID=UPI003CE7B6F5
MTKRLPQFFSAFVGLCLALTTPAQAQQRPSERGCGTTENNEAMQQQLERLVPGYNRNTQPSAPTTVRKTTAQNYTIPIVFHVVHNGEAVGTGSNISDARILEQMSRLNEDFAKLNADRSKIPGVFQGAHADVQVQFALAQKDLAGNCFNGINRVNRTAKGWTAPPYSQSYCNSTIKPGSSWDPSRYLNFWVVELGDGLLGFAQFPDNTAGLGGLNASGGTANTDGVVCLYSSVGNGGLAAAPYNLGRTATHEVGHWLGLRHIWGDGSCATDYVADTPTQSTSNYGCPAFPKVTCSNGPNGDMFMNYMDYTDDACMFMFSAGQKDRMQAVMAANTPRRTSLATSSALPPDVTYAATTSTPLVCAGSTISLAGTAPAGYTYSWTGPNGFTSTQQNPSLSNVTTEASGTYTMITAPAGGCPISANVDVTVRPISTSPALTASNGGVRCGSDAVLLTATPFGNQTATIINQNWNVGTTEGGWTRDNTGSANGRNTAPVWATSTTTPGVNGTRFIMVDASSGKNNDLTRSSLYSPVFSAANLSSLSLSFQHIFKVKNGANDLGKVEISSNGGSTWTTLQTYITNQGSSNTSAASPAAVTIYLDAYAGMANLQLRWNYSSDNGQNWSVDDISVSGRINNTYTWSLVSGDGLPANPGTASTLSVSPTTNSVYQVTVTTPGSCASVATTVSVTLPTSTTWTGAANNGDWTNAGNWSSCVPTRITTATIPSGLSTAYPDLDFGITGEVGNLIQNGPLTLSGGSLVLFGDHTGTGTYTQNGGAFFVSGSSAQNLRGLTYGALTLNGTGIKTLQNNATATGSVRLNGSMLNTGNYTLTLAPTANLIESGSSYIVGSVQASATVAAGSSSSFNGLGATIGAPAGSVAPGFIQALRVTGTPITHNSLPGGESISRYFDLTPAVNSGLNLDLTLTYNLADLGSKPENLLSLYRAVSLGSNFERISSSLDQTTRRVSATGVNHLSVWTLAASSAPLPVELTAFSATAVGADARLSWTTATEKNNDYFEVQVSTNGSQFTSLGRVNGHGNSTRPQNYTLTDGQVARYNTPVLYYRLRQVDLDGTATLSPVRSLVVGKGSEAGFSAQLFPNPSALTTAAPRLLVAGPTTGPLILTLRDALGRVLSRREVAAAGSAPLNLPEAEKLAAGLYILEVQQATHHLSVKLMRE